MHTRFLAVHVIPPAITGESFPRTSDRHAATVQRERIRAGERRHYESILFCFLFDLMDMIGRNLHLRVGSASACFGEVEDKIGDA